MDEHQERIRLFEKRQRNCRSILSEGTLLAKDSVHRTALCAEPSHPPDDLPGIRLKPHQVKNAICMRACEGRGKLPLREGSQTHVLSNIAVLCDPPGSGMMTSMIAHLTTAPPPRPKTSKFFTVLRERAEKQKWRNSVVINDNMLRIDPPSPLQMDAAVFQPTTLIITHHGIIDTWAEQLRKLAPGLRLKVVAKSSDANGILVELPDVVLMYQTFYATVSRQFANLRLARLVFNNCLQLNVQSSHDRYNSQHGILKACFTWLIEPQPEVYLQIRDTVGPDQRRP
jgi:hypothetical protein